MRRHLFGAAVPAALTTALLAIVVTGCGDDREITSTQVAVVPDRIEEPPDELAGASVGGEPTPGIQSGHCTPVPPEVTTLTVAPPWEEGQVRELVSSVERSDSRAAYNTSTSTPVTLTVTSVADDGVGFQWATDQSDSAIASSLGVPLQVVDELPAIPPLRYGLEGDGRDWQGVENISELRVVLGDLYAVYENLLPDDGAGGVDIVDMVAQWPDEVIANLFSADAQVYHGPEGLEVEVVGLPRTVENELPNPLGGSPLPARTTIAVLEPRDLTDCVSIEFRTVLDPAAFDTAADEAYAALGGEPGTAPTGELPPDLSIEHSVVIRYDHGTGYIKSASAVRRIEGGGISIVETRTIDDHTDD